MSEASKGRTVRLFLADGTANGLLTAELINWSGKALAAPRSEIGRLLRRDEAEKTGIYVLIGPDPDSASGTRAYVGEADNVAKRIRRHERDEDMSFFDRAAIVVSKDENLTKAHARFLESQLIRLAKEAGGLALANGTDPGFAIPPEADRSDMAFFLEQLRIVLPLLGFDLFKPSAQRAVAKTKEAGGLTVFEYDGVGTSARGAETADGFVVFAGSTARRKTTSTFCEGHKVLRDQLLNRGALIPDSDPTLYRFAEDVLFSSPTAAVSIVAAHSISGPQSWCVAGSSQTYKEWREGQLVGDDHQP